MKKVVCCFLVLALSLSTCALAAGVPSKTTADMVEAEVSIGNSTPSTNVVFEVVTSTPAAGTEEPVEVAQKREAAVEASNTELTKLVEAIQQIEMPVVSDGTTELTPEQKKEVAVAQTKVIEEYFGEITTATGETTSLTAVLGTETAAVDEFLPMVIAGLEEGCGEATMTLAASNVYSQDEKVAVLVGIVDENGTIVWQECETMIDENGKLQVKFSEETLLSMQNGTAMLAVVSE